MDRLVCGDVGYGKTEVAMRAACKAALAGKQAAVVCPTTLLADQHLMTFRERFERFPVRVGLLSRLRSRAEQRRALSELAAGSLDIVIGTHRLLSPDVRFKDLGLLVVDEEQRFGVAQKELLLRWKTTVDVLTLTATPIPRTMHMALTGMRDVSRIDTPPANRVPVETYVTERNDEIARQSALREIERGGQVFYVWNRVRGIQEFAARLRQLLPEAKLAVAHGRMDEAELERVMEEFLGRQHDVLLATTIVESGLDVPNANTIVIERADALGLAQLYQLRGRVGRSGRQAYAYLFYERDRALTEVAQRRLAAIEEFTQMGAGFRISLRDLEIRGGGNLLGAEQHGHLEAVGFELYMRLLEEAVSERRGEELPDERTARVDLKVDAFLPEDFVRDPMNRLAIYRRLAGSSTEKDVAEVASELRDRFGALPAPVRTLLDVAAVRACAVAAKVSSVASEGETVWLRPDPELSLSAEKVEAFVRTHRGAVVFTERDVGVPRNGRTDAELIPFVRELLAALA